jgi:hypothetical protein
MRSTHRKDSSSSSSTDKNEDPPALPFVTTSDLLSRLNQHLSELSYHDHDDNHYHESHTKNHNSSTGAGGPPRFELQKRLPNGSTIPATPADVAYADLQQKLSQSATFVAQLQESSDRALWAEQQRQIGNAYFLKADYSAAMDIYLTCLVVKDSMSSSSSSSSSELSFVRNTLIPVLNNLAQCTLQLGMYKKTMEFCTIALDEIKQVVATTTITTITTTPDDVVVAGVIDPLAQCKIFFKRAKARRLSGLYKEARDDLKQATKFLDKKETMMGGNVVMMEDTVKDETATTTTTTTTTTSMSKTSLDLTPHRRALQKECQLLELSEQHARTNRRNQKRALQTAWQQSPEQDEEGSERRVGAATAGSGTTSTATTSTSIGSEIKPPRQYSSVKARKTTPMTTEPPPKPADAQLSYFQYYCFMVVRVTETLLIWLGDEETIKKVKERAD